VRRVDIDLLKTFLEVHRTRHFGQAAENLFVSQSAVSARIRLLEDTIGVPLFTRTRNNIQPTAAGERLLRFAENIVTSWNRARQEIAVKEQARALLAAAGVPSLWDVVLQDWLHCVHRQYPDLALNAEVHGADALLRRLRDGTVDVAFMFETPQMAELVAAPIAQVHLVLVSTQPGLTPEQAVSRDYVWVDWGTWFAITHAQHFPDMPAPVLRAGLGRLGQAFVLEHGGAAYLAERSIMAQLQQGLLHRVDGAPVMERSAYAVYRLDSEKRAVIEESLSLFSD